ncbi:MAG: hypothetical protein LW855_01540 [Alphaproteobacteria bacterium]|jgi:flagellar basal-body rod modification protein FlgD|nr:hypothetical protein [Alphaproteobacteria bacterium]
MVSTVNTGLAATSGSTNSQKATKVFGDNLNSFLKLLTTQLQNQDPLEPMDSAAFTNQLVQFANVEQAIGTNRNMEKLLTATTANQNLGTLSYLGKTVDANANTVFFNGTDNASFRYQSASDYARASVSIINEKGTTVRTLDVNPKKGVYTVNWDGKDTQGFKQPNGFYSVKVNGFDSKDKATRLSTVINGTVTAVGNENGQAMLTVNGIPLPTTAVIAVREPQPK